jgi:arylformamidase
MANGDAANVSSLCFGAHTGTHVDAPNHFINGTRRVDELEIEKLIGPCRVVEIDESIVAIGPEHVGDLTGIERLLLKTRNSDFWNTRRRMDSEQISAISRTMPPRRSLPPG